MHLTQRVLLFVLFLPKCLPKVEVQFAKNAFDNILRNATLDGLYEENGKALGMEFTTDEEVLKNSSGRKNISYASHRPSCGH